MNRSIGLARYSTQLETRSGPKLVSPFWKLWLLLIPAGLALGANRLRGSGGSRRRFLIGFEVYGVAAAVGYAVSCSRPALWSLVSTLLPVQPGFLGCSWDEDGL